MKHGASPHHEPLQPGGPPTDAPVRWKIPRVAATAGLAAFLGLAGAGVAFAVSGHGASASSPGPVLSGGALTASGGTTTTPPSAPPAGRHGMGRFGPGPGMMGGAVVHGTFTEKDGSGYRVEQIQSGVVQPGNTPTSITVKSDDGYSQTYTVQPSTVVDAQAGGISTVSSGDRVRVRAVQQGSGYTATDIVDQTKIGSSRQGFGFAPAGPPVPGEKPSAPAA